jgi:hypothetical protein
MSGINLKSHGIILILDKYNVMDIKYLSQYIITFGLDLDLAGMPD